MSTTSPPLAPPKTGGRLILWIGILAPVIGFGLYLFQVTVAKKFWFPWYAPGLATLGTLLILLSLGRRFGIVRLFALLLIGALTAGVWWFMLVYARLPHDTGKIVKDHPFPPFTATLAKDGSDFTQHSLDEGKQNTVLVFFRGHF
jgi:hypothetical protein